ncbi:AbrB/MazE/SpoVT family DNA-binding domain-containing protein [Microbacterium sp. bgisy207]|uniref:AbrB/MazE/SpoVT family DNA-binding domain-containing protein n=1 Tax=Microbacterium sp. bgisy207 TaxID=3413800 RepID=UPI003EB86AF0
MKLNAKGQVTIPAELRHKHGFATGDEVEVIDDGGVLRIIHRDDPTPGQRAVLRVRGAAGPGPATDEILTLTRNRRAPDVR